MPRLYDAYLDSVVYLYRNSDEATRGVNIGGSGFLVSVPCERLSSPNMFAYVVTNKHVADRAMCVRINTPDGATIAVDLQNWIRAEHDDLAIHLLPDVRRHSPLIRTIPKEFLITEKIVKQSNVGIGDEVVVIGRFINREGQQKNTPTARFGFISQGLADPIEYDIDGKKHSQLSFLAEVKSIGGYSGSPVFLVADPDLRLGGEPLPIDQTKSLLLGVDCCHVESWSSVIERGTENKSLRVKSNTGMMCVIPAWRLNVLLDSKTAVEERAQHEEMELRKRGYGRVAISDGEEG